MKKQIALLAPFACSATLLPAQTIVDWWNPVANGSGLDLVDENGSTAGGLQFNVAEGLAFPGFPKATILSEDSWSTSPSFSENGSTTVPGIDLKVAPLNGSANFDITLTWQTNSPIYLLFGQLFQDNSGRTSPVTLLPTGSASQVELVETLAWSNGLDEFVTPLAWDPLLSQLSPATTDSGESQLALFRISGAKGLTVSIPDGYPTGTGDELTLALGRVVPEPSTFALLTISVLLCLNSRKNPRISH